MFPNVACGRLLAVLGLSTYLHLLEFFFCAGQMPFVGGRARIRCTVEHGIHTIPIALLVDRVVAKDAYWYTLIFIISVRILPDGRSERLRVC